MAKRRASAPSLRSTCVNSSLYPSILALLLGQDWVHCVHPAMAVATVIAELTAFQAILR